MKGHCFYEIQRQKEETRHKRSLYQETRAWDSEKGITFSLRKKETEEDYGYIIDSDLTLVDITADWLMKIKSEMPELAQDKVKKFIDKYGLKKEDAEVIASDKPLAELLEKVAKHADATLAAKWVRREVTRVLNYSKKTLHESKITEKNLTDLLKLIQNKKITEQVGQKIIEMLAENDFDVNEYVKKKN